MSLKYAALQGVEQAREKMAAGGLTDILLRLKTLGATAAAHPLVKELLANPEISATIQAGRDTAKRRMVEAVQNAFTPKTFMDRHAGKVFGGVAGLGALGMLAGAAGRHSEPDPFDSYQ